MEDIGTASDGGTDLYDDSPAFDGEQKQRPRDTEPTPNNLTNYRWRHAIPSSGDERDLIRAAQAGDEKAKSQIAKNYHRMVLAIASEFHGPLREDIIAAGELGCSEALVAYELTRNTGLSAFARHKIRNAMRAAVKQWRKRGQAGETRADRWVYSHRDATPGEVADKVGCGVKDAGAALQRAEAYWHGHESYDAIERGVDDDEDDRQRTVVVVDVAPEEVHPGGGAVTDSDWEAIRASRSRRQAPDVDGNLIKLRFDPLKPVERARYAADQQAAHRVGAGLTMLSGLRTRVDRVVDWWAAETDRRAARRLKQIGRRAYALELVEKERARNAARADPRNYLYPWVAHGPRKMAWKRREDETRNNWKQAA